MKSRYQIFLFLFRYFFLAERSLNPELDAPVTSRINDRFLFAGKIKTVLWAAISILLSFLLARLH